MRNPGYDPNVKWCLMCILSPIEPTTCVIRAGARWVEVTIIVDADQRHYHTADDLDHSIFTDLSVRT